MVAVAIACAGSLYLLTRLNREFLPLLDEGSILMTVDTPPGSSLEETLRVTRLLVNDVLRDPDVETTVSQTGHAPGMQDTDTMNHSDVFAKLVPRDRRKKSIDELFAAFRKKAEAYPGVAIDFTMPLQDKLNDAIGGVSKTIGVNIFRRRHQNAARGGRSRRVAARKNAGRRGFKSRRHRAGSGRHRRAPAGPAAALGVTREDLNNVVEAMSYGMAGDVGARSSQASAARDPHGGHGRQFSDAEQIPTRTNADPHGQRVLRAVDASGPRRLRRRAEPTGTRTHRPLRHRRAATSPALKTKTVVAAIQTIFSEMKLPAGITYEITGSTTAQTETTKALFGIGVAALLLVSAILWIEFRSLRKMFLVLLTIPLSTVGASAALWATRQTLNISSLIGLVMLVGIVLRNGIVLVDYIHLAVERGRPLREAVEEGAHVRLRPILMTALSEILGLTPLALGIGSGSALERPLAIAVIGGLVTSTFLTLYVLEADRLSNSLF